MTHPPKPSGSHESVPLGPVSRKQWPWTQMGLLLINLGLFFTALEQMLIMYSAVASTSESKLGTFCGVLLLGGVMLLLRSAAARMWGEKPAPVFPKLRWCNIGVFGAFVSYTLLSLVIPAVHAAQKTAKELAATREAETDPDTWQTVVSPKCRVQIDLPGHWGEAADPGNGINELVRVDPTGQAMLLVLSTPKEDVTYPNLTAWGDAILQEIEANAQDVEVLEKTFQAKPDPPTIGVVMMGSDKQTRLVFVVRLLELPKSFVFARVITTPSVFREQEDTLRQVVASIRVE